jgi:hypothetical protein
VVVLVILAVVAALASRMVVRRSADRRNFGPEYSRLVDEVGTRRANAEYDKRRRRVDGLGITPLTDERRALYRTQWLAAQETFIDNPAESVRSAAALVTATAADRGYQVTDSDQLMTDLSVDYGNQLDGYRSALTVTRASGDAATEKLRRALLDFRAMFRALAGIGDEGHGTARATQATGATGTAVTTGAGTRPAAVAAAAPATSEPVTTAMPARAASVAPGTGGAPHASEASGNRVFWRRESGAGKAG